LFFDLDEPAGDVVAIASQGLAWHASEDLLVPDMHSFNCCWSGVRFSGRANMQLQQGDEP
jgi:hypothetical protein